MTKKQNKDNCIHVIDLKKQTINPMNNFELSMWSNTDGKSVEKIITRINKLNLSETAENLFQT